MSTILAPVLFTTAAQDSAGNILPWRDVPNILIEDTAYAWAEWTVSSFRRSDALLMGSPNFPAFPSHETPVWLKLTVEIDAHISASSGTFREQYVKWGDGAYIEYDRILNDGPQTLTYSGRPAELGITRDQAADIINGVTDVELYFTSDDPDSIMRVLWAKLEAKLEAPQTEVLTPPVTF